MMSTNRRNILVTGFGPFGIHTVNASWEAVKLLPENIDGFIVVKEQIPVSYNIVDNTVKQLWIQHEPKLVIHVGVSAFADKLTLETCAQREGYHKEDHFGNCPTSGNCCNSESQEKCISVGIDIAKILDKLNAQQSAIKFCVSKDAGRYLCEYIFYTSLSLNKNTTLFIHVPPLHQPYSAEELAYGISEVIRLALKQLTV